MGISYNSKIMNWFILSLIPPILFALAVYIDKYLISRFKNKNTQEETSDVGSLILYSSLFGIIICLFLLIIFRGSIFEISNYDKLILTASGLCGVFAMIFYLYAIEKDEASIVAPLFQLIPIFGLLFEFLIIGTVPSSIQIWGSLLIVLSGIALTMEFESLKIKKIKLNIFILMFLSSMFFSMIAVLFKFVTADESLFWISSFWEYLAWGFLGIILFLFNKKYRRSFLNSFKNDGITISGINLLNESINTIANSSKNFAALLVPVALVYSVEALQPMFIFFFGIIVSVFFPKIIKEDISRKALIQKTLFIVLMIIGTILLIK